GCRRSGASIPEIRRRSLRVWPRRRTSNESPSWTRTTWASKPAWPAAARASAQARDARPPNRPRRSRAASRMRGIGRILEVESRVSQADRSFASRPSAGAGSAHALREAGIGNQAAGHRVEFQGDALDGCDLPAIDHGRGEAGMPYRREQLLERITVKTLYPLGAQFLEGAVGADVDHQFDAAGLLALEDELLESDRRKGEPGGNVGLPRLDMGDAGQSGRLVAAGQGGDRQQRRDEQGGGAWRMAVANLQGDPEHVQLPGSVISRQPIERGSR